MSEGRTVPQQTGGIALKTLRVRVARGPDSGQEFIANSDLLCLGTNPGNDAVLTDPTVSGYHLELQIVGDHVVVQDLGSTNGTRHGAVRIERGHIRPGTTLLIGRSEIVVDEGAAAEVAVFSEDKLGPLRGRSEPMVRLMARIARVANSDASVLVLGETGTGKELIARAIHKRSDRAGGPLETVDCGSLIPALIASELFGHEKGAFTGADRRHIGAFERAHGGTLFLDEIGELPGTLQPALLGALERRSFKRVGGKQPIEVDVRLVCATHRDLRAQVNAGTFRDDLYYRLAVVLLKVPPLRARLDDVQPLVDHFVMEAGYEGSPRTIIPQSVLDALRQHHWPGNVRELRNFVEAALVLGETPELSPASAQSLPTDDFDDVPYSEAKSALLKDFEVRYLTQLLKRSKDNVSAAARAAKMNRSYLLDLLKRHGMK